MSRDSTEKNSDQDIPRNPGNDDNADKNEVNAGFDPRQAALNDLAAKRREEREQSLAETSDPAISAESTAESPDSNTELANDSDYVKRDGKVYLRTKVDGEEGEVELSKVKSNYQKYMAGDKRLAEAADREKQLQIYEQQLFLREQAMRQRQQESEPPKNSGASDDVEANVDAVLEAIYSGDDDTAKKALANLVAGRQQPTQNAITPDEIDQRVLRTTQATIAQMEQQRELKSASQKFRSEFNDIASDPKLFGMADELTLEIAEANPDFTPYQIMQEAGNRVREWLSTFKSSDSGMSDRTQRKRQAMGAVAGANRAASLGKDAPPARTRSNVIEDMKRQRGQMI